jgi:hypothetical protein
MVHYKENVHKVFGSIPFSFLFYTHFHDEHVKGHHKTVSTLDDPVFPPIGRNVYYGIYHSFVYTHVTTWKREVERINKIYPNCGLFKILCHNIMVYYFILHVSMLLAIFKLFG